MDENKAIKIIRQEMGWESKSSTLRAFEKAIEALEEIQQYRAIGTAEELQDMKSNYFEALSDWRQYRKIGTLEECRAAVEKQTAKKVKSISQIKDGDSYVGLIGRCPCCGHIGRGYRIL